MVQTTSGSKREQNLCYQLQGQNSRWPRWWWWHESVICAKRNVMCFCRVMEWWSLSEVSSWEWCWQAGKVFISVFTDGCCQFNVKPSTELYLTPVYKELRSPLEIMNSISRDECLKSSVTMFCVVVPERVSWKIWS